MTGRGLGVSIMPLDNRRETLVAAAVEADRLGYDAFFLPESRGRRAHEKEGV